MDIRRNKKNDRLCKERNDMLDSLPLGTAYEVERDAWLNEDHRIYYKRKGRKVVFACTNKECEKEFYTQSISLEESTRSYTGEIRHGLRTTCPICGKTGLMVAEGRRRRRDIVRKNFAVYQMPREDLLTIRIVQVEKEYNMTMLRGVRKPGREDWETETIRVYLYADHRVYKDYHKSGFDRDFWDYKNLNGMENIEMPIFLHHIGEGITKDAGWLKYIDFTKRPFGAMERIRGYMAATEYPIMEMLQKTGAYRIASDLAYENCKNLNKKARKPEFFFNITKARLKKLIRENEGSAYLEIYQQEKKYGITMPENLVNYIAERNDAPDPEIWQYTTPVKYWNYIKKQEAIKKKEEYSGCWGYSVSGLHNDYLQAVKDLGLPLSNTIYLYPKDLRQKHNEFVQRRNLQQDQQKIKEKNETYKKIQERYTKLLKKYGYEKGGLIIRPAGSAGEIIREGRMLHHCVGGDNYLSKHDRGETYILFLRRAEEPEIPWCTIEIKGSNVLQWYEKYDQKPDRDLVDPFLKEYTKQLEKKKRAAG